MHYFAGIDGGQSSTTCLIGDETGLVMGVGEAGPCNHAGSTKQMRAECLSKGFWERSQNVSGTGLYDGKCWMHSGIFMQTLPQM